MKKLTGTSKSYISRVLLLLLIFAMMVSGCALPDTQAETPTEPTAAPTEPVSKYNNPMNLPEAQLDELVRYLDLLNADINFLTLSAAAKINSIKNGKQALHVAFDPSNLYYICGYYNCTHQYEESFPDYCCAMQYEWIKFDSAADIQEYYDDAKMVVAFQINKALFVKDIKSDETNIPDIEHFQLYTPKFVDGVNTSQPVVFNETCIYLTDPGETCIYRSFSVYNHKTITIPCVLLESSYYIPVQLSILYSGGQETQNDINKMFGDYYDAVAEIMIMDKYSITYETGAIATYGLLEVNEFANAVLK